jgi:hypothetical protein
MKRILFCADIAAALGLFFVACGPSGGGEEETLNRAFLYSGSGEWISTQDFGDGPEEIHDKFAADGTGSSWSATDDGIPQSFTWSLSGKTLRFVHRMESGAAVPKEYTVVILTESRLVYEDDWGNRISCTKLSGTTR